MKELKKDVQDMALLEAFDEEIEGYGNCGDSDANYKCKKDCIFAHNAVVSAIY